MATRDDLPNEFEEMLRYGTVSSVDHATGRVVVSVGELETSDIVWLERRAGATRTWSPPSEGEQVLLLCPSGEIEGAIAIGGIAQDSHPHPGDSARELIRFADGAELAYDPEAHKLDVTLPEGGTLVVAAAGGVTINGAVTINGDLSVAGAITASEDVTGGGVSLKSHRHGNVQPGAGQTGTPQ